ncbi:E3 ubiquitin-protein ligase HUWE1-like [Mustelus asterias]
MLYKLSTPEENREGKKDKDSDKASEDGKQKAKASKPLMPTSTILRLLAELVRSYIGIATLIAGYNYTAGQSELIKEDCSVLAFVLDHLLPQTQNVGDKDTPALARLFLASLAAATQSTEAQAALVNEVKAALSRALAMAESTEKHARLQAVMCIISTIMESCPSTSSFYSSNAVKTQHNGMNNIIRLFLKKGLVNDLARVPHSLDLSSPNMANTVNAALKPLETLSRIVNQPSSLFSSKNASSKNKSEQDTHITSGDANGNQPDSGETGETEAQEDHAPAGVADSDIMDGETEADTVVITGQSEVLNAQEMQVENELEDLIDELLERDVETVSSTIIACRSTEDESQEDVLMDEAPSNLSQAPTLQANREDSMNILDPDDEEHTQEEDSSGSNEDDDDSQDEDEEEEEDEDDQDDEEGEEEEGDEDDEDEEGSEMELDEDYPDIDESLVRFDREDDLIIEFDNMFSTAADIPPAPGNIPATHPLMVRHADHSALTLGTGSSTTRLTQGIGRSQRAIRPFAANTGHTIHVHYPGNRQPNPPLILQRLLGPSAAADILQLSSSLPLQSRGRARLLVGNDDVHIIARSDDDLLDDFFHDQTATTSQAGTLSSIPTALTRWTEECKVLDAESMHDCVAVVKLPVIQHLESLRDEELEERREKRRKQLAEEEARREEKSKEEKENKEQNASAAGSTRVANSSVQGDKSQTGVSSSALSATNEAISNMAASIAEAALEAMRTHGQLTDGSFPELGALSNTGVEVLKKDDVFLGMLANDESTAIFPQLFFDVAALPEMQC